MSLLLVAELLAGEALPSPGGAVDRLTAISDDVALWGVVAAEVEPERELVLVSI